MSFTEADRRMVSLAQDAVPAFPVPASLMDAILETQEKRPPRRVDGLVIGWLVALEDDSTAHVSLPSLTDRALTARALCPLGEAQLGAQCAVMFEQGDPERPVVMGLLQHPVLPVSVSEPLAFTRDQDRILLEARQEILLHCGKASLRLTPDGRIELRGTTVVSHATGLNRIRGASVKLN